MTETPAPASPDAAVEVAAVELLFAAVLFAVLGWLLVWAMLRAADREPRAMVVMVVGLLTLVAMLSFAVTGAEVLGTLAATGIGALAGAVTSLFEPPSSGDDNNSTP